MIIEFSELFGEKDPDFVGTELSRYEMFLHAHACGRHVVILSNNLLQKLKRGKESFSNKQYAALLDIEENRSEYRGMAKNLDCSILVVPDGCSKEKEAERHKLVIDIGSFVDEEMLDRPRMLVENGTYDGLFYKYMAEAFRKDLGVNRKFSFDFASGGGTGIASEYGRMSQEYRPLICVADSDQASPGGALGQTANNLLQKKGQESHPFCFIKVIGVREAENFIPIECIDELYEGNKEMGAVIEKLYRIRGVDLHRTEGFETLRFTDLKRGIDTKAVRGFKNTNDSEFYIETWRRLEPGRSSYDPWEEDIYIVPPVSDKLLPNFIGYFDRPQWQRRFAGCVRRSCVSSDVLDLARVITAFFAHPSKVTV